VGAEKRHCRTCERPWPEGYGHCPSSGQVWHREKEKRDVAEALAALRAEFGSSQKGETGPVSE
jgi:hypothetical protein